MEKKPEAYSRSEKSLSTLTKKFVEMLQADPVLDLNTACLAMDVAKKRRIYDITNVLEGCNLIKKVGKNLYSWTGRRDDGTSLELLMEKEELCELKEEAERMKQHEQDLNDAIKVFEKNIAFAQHNKSYCYLTKDDLTNAFGDDNSVLVLKHFKNIKMNFDSLDSDVQFDKKAPAAFRDMLVTGDVLRPITLKMVNTEAKQNCDSNLLFCLDDMESDEEEKEKRKTESIVKTTSKVHRTYPERSQNLNLFRRRQKVKKLLEMDEKEREKLASVVLDSDRFKDKSMFHFIQEKQMVTAEDYVEPDFLTLEQPPDSDYQENYSAEAPSVHDLFDFNAEPLDDDVDYEMFEFIEEDEDL